MCVVCCTLMHSLYILCASVCAAHSLTRTQTQTRIAVVCSQFVVQSARHTL
jgi:hypothetical protein